MGKYTGGINHGFSGKTGSVIGSRWRKINYMKGLPRRSHKKATEGQIEQRDKFSMMVEFLVNLSDILVLGFNKINTNRQTVYNYALSYNLRWAFKTGDSGLEIDFSRVMISKGRLPKASDARAEMLPDNTVKVTWPPEAHTAVTSPEDKATVLLYCPVTKLGTVNSGKAERGDGGLVLAIPGNSSKDVCHVLIFFTSPGGDNSPTFYIGPVSYSEASFLSHS